jgi:hypothetical protein
MLYCLIYLFSRLIYAVPLVVASLYCYNLAQTNFSIAQKELSFVESGRPDSYIYGSVRAP